MADGHCFISYSTHDGLDFTRKLRDELEGGDPPHAVWYDKADLTPSYEWDSQIVEAIKSSKCVLFLISEDSTKPASNCKTELTFALRYKKPIVPLLLQKKAEQPFLLGTREWIDFTEDFDSGIAKLRKFLRELNEPEGVLRELQYLLGDAEHELRRAKGAEEKRIQADVDELNKQIEAQKKIADDPKAAEEQTKKNIEAGLERERKPEKPIAAQTSTKFINPPPGIAPNYFQDRMVETEQIVHFLQDDSQRLMTIIGRGGVGKTAMVCRLLKGLEGGELPDGLGSMKVEGIVYLSESGSHRVNFANLFYDLCKLLPADAANALDAVYKNPQASTTSKMSALLDRFTAGKVVLLLDNVEPLISVETFDIADAELDECLRALLHGAHSALKVILTTRVAPRGLNLCEPGRQRVLTLDSGLEQKYAVEMLREMDVDGKLGLKSAAPEALKRAYERTLGFPRALEALFAILASDRYTTLEELLAMPTPVNVVEALVGEAFNRLDMNAQKVMQALAVYNRPVTPAAVDYLLAPHIPAIDSAPILKRLVSMHFARRFEGGKFYLHPMDSEFAYNLLPEGSSDDIAVEKGGLKLFKKLWDLLEKYPDLLQNQDTFNQAVKNENANIVIGSVMAFQNLDDSLVEKMQQEGIFQDENFLAELDKSFQIPPIWSRYALNNRAADYFAQARKPRAEWKKLEDLSAQLAEFDLRCAAGDYDAAASVLTEIDMNYLFLWGHYRLMIQLHEKLKGNITNNWLNGYNLTALSSAYSNIGKTRRAIEFGEQALEVDRKNKDRPGESVDLGNLGIWYYEIGDTKRAISYEQEALIIARELSNEGHIGRGLENLSRYFIVENLLDDAINIIQESLGKEIVDVQIGSENYRTLALAYFYHDEMERAKQAIELAEKYNYPPNNHNASALHGIIALRQGDEVTARGAFVRAIGQADEILAKTAEYYSALDAKGLSICGLLICDLRLAGRGDPSMPTKTNDGKTISSNESTVNAGRVAPTVEDAIETFRKARKIAPHAGVVKSVLRLFDELAKCDTEGILKNVRNAVEGK